MAAEQISDRLQIETGIPGDDQESAFMNGTLQMLTEHNLAFTVQTFVEAPAQVSDEQQLRAYLVELFRRVAAAEPALSFDIQTGPNYPDGD